MPARGVIIGVGITEALCLFKYGSAIAVEVTQMVKSFALS
jgi:hypothetical protein